MARKKSGGFGKVLNFIGLVDDEDPRDAYENEYQADNYGRQQAYVPQRANQQRRANERSRQELTPVRRYPAANYEPTRAPRMDRSNGAYEGRFDSRSRGNTRANTPRREENRPGRYDYSPRAQERTSRFGSLNGQEVSARFEDEAPRSMQPAPRQNRSARQRTVMFALHSLEDCCDVIDNLIMNNTVILTLDDLEPKLMQRAVDTLSGAVFALHATIRKASDRTYLIAPNSVEVNENDEENRFF